MDDMRRDFEAWAVIDKERERCLDKFIDGAYCDFWVEDAWQAYQEGRASAALQALNDIGQEQQPECYWAGWKMVPIKMPEKAYGTIGRAASGHWRPNDAGNAEKFWDAMISAAPDQEEG